MEEQNMWKEDFLLFKSTVALKNYSAGRMLLNSVLQFSIAK